MEDLQKLVLVGGGGTSSDVLALIASINKESPRYDILGLLDDGSPVGTMCFGFPVLGGLQANTGFAEDVHFVDCLGSTRSYLKREAILNNAGFNLDRFETIIHPTAFIAEDAKIGLGTIIYPNVVMLSNVTIGQHVIVLSGAVLNHDVSVGDWSIIASGVMLSGAVKVESTCYLGSSSSVREGIHIHNGALIGMGAVVIQNVSANQVVAGVPARAIRNAK